MIERLAVDTNALVEWFRTGEPAESHLTLAERLVVPLPVVGELYAGAYASTRRDFNVRVIDAFVGRYEVISPDGATAVLYGQLRARLRLDNIRSSKSNDVWIAALAIQHALPLLTNDRGFDVFAELRTIHW